MTAAPLNIGRYQVTDRLGHGGMGTVFLARDPSLERFVAIKLMRQGFDTPDMRERFVREARAVAGLRHPCIVTLFEYGDHNGQPFIVMEYVTGKTLAALIAERTPMTLARQLQLIEDLCRGLEHAHRAGIIHRDVKPANIMVDGEGILKILDFGIAKQGHAGVTHITGLVGTPKYMAPEQISGKPVTRRSDIFSVGLVAYEILSLESAFSGSSDFAVMNAILTGELTPLTVHVPHLEPRVVRIVEKALERDPDRRYQDLSQMRRDVERIRLELVIAEPPAPSTVQVLQQPKVQRLEELGHRRAQQIAANLENAERAFELGDFDAAQAACEDVLIIDPMNARGIEGLQRAAAALTERQALAHLATARQHFAANEMTHAEAALRSAFELAPALREALELQEQLGSVRQKREQRSLALKFALDRAKIRFGEGAFESAVHAAEEALSYDPADPEAQRLKEVAAAALDEQRIRVGNRRAQAAVEEATKLVARDRYDHALAVLSGELVASHPVVQDARARIERSRDSFERLKADAAARDEATRIEAAARAAEAAAVPQTTRIEPSPAAREDTVRFPRPDLHILVAPHAAGDLHGARILSIEDSPGFLPGAPRKRRPRPPRRPVQFLAVDGTDRGTARAFMTDQVFVASKTGHDSVGFGASLGAHIAIAAAIGTAILAKPALVPDAPSPHLVMVTAVTPPPPPIVTTPQPSAPVRRAATQQAVLTPPLAVPQAPPPAPIEVPTTLPTGDTAPPVLPVTPVDAIQPVVIAPPSPLPGGSINATVTEVPVEDYDIDPVLTKRVQPRVPVGASGRVRVEVTISSFGKVTRVRILDTTPYADAVRQACGTMRVPPGDAAREKSRRAAPTDF
jgi:tetratricopeptide (TPR) repeat protein/predicted Ser/Thr protein kinase